MASENVEESSTEELINELIRRNMLPRPVRRHDVLPDVRDGDQARYDQMLAAGVARDLADGGDGHDE